MSNKKMFAILTQTFKNLQKILTKQSISRTKYKYTIRMGHTDEKPKAWTTSNTAKYFKN